MLLGLKPRHTYYGQNAKKKREHKNTSFDNLGYVKNVGTKKDYKI